VNSEKISKRKGTVVFARTYLDHLSPDYLRYYLASKLTGSPSDLDFLLEEFVAKVNADLVGKVVNLASRTARFVEGQPLSAQYPDDGGLFAAGAALGREIADAYEACDTGKVTRLVMALADRANEFVEARAPWALRKRGDAQEELRDACSVALNLFHQRPNAISDAGLRLAQAFADVATIGILQQRAVQRSTDLAGQLQTALNSRLIIEQAKGVLAERENLDMPDAFEMLRGYSRRAGRKLSEVAAAVVAGELTTDDLTGPATRPDGR